MEDKAPDQNPSDPRQRDPRTAQHEDPAAGQSDDPRVDATRKGAARTGPTADAAMENASPGDGSMQDDLTEERDVSPERREEVAHTQPQDP